MLGMKRNPKQSMHIYIYMGRNNNKFLANERYQIPESKLNRKKSRKPILLLLRLLL
ncbi:hypothetical protein Hanom_Chr11g01018491 [Helianthus anomalus]